jgi:hypothetical protein
MNSLLDNSGSGRSILNDIHKSIIKSRRSKKNNSINRSKNKIRSINNSVLSEKSNNGISNINRDTELQFYKAKNSHKNNNVLLDNS